MWRGRPHPRCLKSMKKRVPHLCPCAMSRDRVGILTHGAFGIGTICLAGWCSSQSPTPSTLLGAGSVAKNVTRRCTYGVVVFSPLDDPNPYPSSMARRNFSRSSGLIFRHRPRHRRPPCPPGPPGCSPPNRIRHSASSPKACQNPSVRQPKSGGSSQFHRCMTTSPPTNRNSGIATIANGAIQNHLFLIVRPSFPKLVIS